MLINIYAYIIYKLSLLNPLGMFKMKTQSSVKGTYNGNRRGILN